VNVNGFSLKLVTPPASEPVTVSEAKARLRITISDEDADIGDMIAQARELCEAGCQRAFITQTFSLYLDRFPGSTGDIRLPRPPLQSVSFVKYYDSAGDLQTLDPAAYYVATASEPGRLRPVDYWPATFCRPEAVEVRFVAGYGTAADVPAAAKAAVQLTVKALRDAPDGDLPPAARRCLDTLEFGEVR
ncbi:MAG TPA: hypothetical protein VGE74_30190, partial [Gemmata sp.]